MKKRLLLIGIVFLLLFGFSVEAKSRTCTYKSSDGTVTVRITIDNTEDYKKAVFSGEISAASPYSFQLYDNYGSVEDTRSFKRKLTEVCPSSVYITCSDIHKYCDVGDAFVMSSNLALQVGYKELSLSDADVDAEDPITDPTYGTGIFGTCTKDGCEGTDACPPIFGSASDPESLAGFLSKYIFVPIRYLTPIVLIVMTSIDFAKAVFVDEKDGMGKAKSNFIKRGLTALIIFLAPTIVMTLFTLLDGMQISSCLNSNDIGGL